MLRRLAVLANPDDQNMSFQLAELRGAAGKRRIELRIFEARNAAQVDTALEQMVAWKPQAVFPLANPLRYSERLIQWAAQHRVPVMYAYNPDTLAGGLMAYDADLSDHFVVQAKRRPMFDACQACLKDRERVSISKASHGMFRTHSDVTNAAILTFLDRN